MPYAVALGHFIRVCVFIQCDDIAKKQVVNNVANSTNNRKKMNEEENRRSNRKWKFDPHDRIGRIWMNCKFLAKREETPNITIFASARSLSLSSRSVVDYNLAACSTSELKQNAFSISWWVDWCVGCSRIYETLHVHSEVGDTTTISMPLQILCSAYDCSTTTTNLLHLHINIRMGISSCELSVFVGVKRIAYTRIRLYLYTDMETTAMLLLVLSCLYML